MSIWKVIKTKECYMQVDILLTRKYKFLVSSAFSWAFMVVDHVRSENNRYRKSEFRLICWSLSSCHSQLLDAIIEFVCLRTHFSLSITVFCLCFALWSAWNEKKLIIKSYTFVDREIYEKTVTFRNIK